MKKFISILCALVIILSLAACNSGVSEFNTLRDKVAAAGYEVSDAYVDANFRDVVAAFNVKVNFDKNTIASIPIVLTKSENAAKANCELFGENSIKLPIHNGKIFAYPGKDYPENVLNLVSAIVNGEEIPKNLDAE